MVTAPPIPTPPVTTNAPVVVEVVMLALVIAMLLDVTAPTAVTAESVGVAENEDNDALVTTGEPLILIPLVANILPPTYTSPPTPTPPDTMTSPVVGLVLLTPLTANIEPALIPPYTPVPNVPAVPSTPDLYYSSMWESLANTRPPLVSFEFTVS